MSCYICEWNEVFCDIYWLPYPYDLGLSDATQGWSIQMFQELLFLCENQVQCACTDDQDWYRTVYVNKGFNTFLLEHDILNQTSCPDTTPRNGVAERKNRHILEVARSLIFTMNVPKFLWSEAVMTSTYLINIMPSSYGHEVTLWGVNGWDSSTTIFLVVLVLLDITDHLLVNLTQKQ
jgi:hypothetical protein